MPLIQHLGDRVRQIYVVVILALSAQRVLDQLVLHKSHELACQKLQWQAWEDSFPVMVRGHLRDYQNQYRRLILFLAPLPNLRLSHSFEWEVYSTPNNLYAAVKTLIIREILVCTDSSRITSEVETDTPSDCL